MTATPALLTFAFLAGIEWADIGGGISGIRILLPLILVAAIVAIRLFDSDLAFGPGARVVGGRRRSSRRTCAWGGAALMLAALFSFLSGFDRFDGILAGARRDAQRAERVQGEGIRIAEARVASRRRGFFGDEVELVDVREADGGSPLPERLLLRLDGRATGLGREPGSRSEEWLWPGSLVRLGVRVAPLRYRRNPGSPDRERAAMRRGRVARARLVKPDWVMGLSDGEGSGGALVRRILRWRVGWKKEIATRLEKAGNAGGLVRALALGDRSGIRPGTRQAFRTLGLSHLLAVSGLHVGFVAAFAAWTFLRASAVVWAQRGPSMPFDTALVVACGVAGFYAWLTDAGISVERAISLFGFFAVFRLGLRRIRPMDALAWVALAIAWFDPAALFDLGAQLSFGACGALVAGGFWRHEEIGPGRSGKGQERGRLARIRRMASETFRASLVVSLGTAPLLVRFGLPLSPFSPLFNVVAIPWTGIVVLPASLLAAALAGLSVSRFVSILMWPAEGLASAVVFLASRLPELPRGSLLTTPVLIMSCAWAIAWMRGGYWRRAGLAWIVIAMAGSSPGLDPASVGEPPRIVFFDVGQGDAALVQGREAVVLIDSGPGPPDGSGGAELVRGLEALGVRAIDVLVVTHGDLDHRGGANRVLATLSVEELWLPAAAREDPVLKALSRDARTRDIRVRWLDSTSSPVERGDLTMEILWPGPRTSAEKRNDVSMVLRLSMDGSVYLFTADIGASSERSLSIRPAKLDADVLKVAHHGSRGSSSAGFLDVVTPSIAIVSAPCDASRGLPNKETLARLRDAGGSLWWTGRDGAVFVYRDSDRRLVAKRWGRERSCENRAVGANRDQRP